MKGHKVNVPSNRLLILLALGLTFVSAGAGEPDYRSFFNYPDTQLTVDFGDGHDEGTPFKNHSISNSPAEKPAFGFGFAEQTPYQNTRVQCRFMRKTGTGDLYQFQIYRHEVLVKQDTVLYTGSTVMAYDANHLKVTFEPTKDAKWKAP